MSPEDRHHYLARDGVRRVISFVDEPAAVTIFTPDTGMFVVVDRYEGEVLHGKMTDQWLQERGMHPSLNITYIPIYSDLFH